MLCQGKTCWLLAHILFQLETFLQKKKKKNRKEKKNTEAFERALTAGRLKTNTDGEYLKCSTSSQHRRKHIQQHKSP